MEKASLTFITGGVRSGKSSFAEKVVIEKALEMKGKLHYIATAKSYSDEMNERIVRHQNDREKSGFQWITWEQETDISMLANSFQKSDVVLLDCLTVLLSNELDLHYEELEEKIIFQKIWQGIQRILESSKQVVVVSNELLFEVYDDNPFMRTYYRLMGKLHQQIVTHAKEAYLVEVGIPRKMK